MMDNASRPCEVGSTDYDQPETTAIHRAAVAGSPQELRRLLSAPGGGAALAGKRDRDGRTPLHAAAAAGKADAVRLLLAASADAKARDALGATPLHLAAYWGHAAVARHLLRAGADPADEYSADLALMHQEARLGGVYVGDGDHNNGGRNWTLALSAVHLAAGAGHADALQALLDGGGSATAHTSGGTTPLHMAVAGGHEPAISTLLAAGADAGAEDATGRRALHVAAFAGRAAPVRALLDAGAAVEARDAHGATALHLAAGSGYSHVLAALLKAGAAPEERDTAWNRDALQQLYNEVSEEVLKTVKKLLAAGAKVDARDAGGAAPMHYAAFRGRADIVRALLDAGADPETRGFLRPQPRCDDDAVQEIISAPDTQQEAEVAEGDRGLTAVQAAVAGRSAEVLELLLQVGADPGAAERLGGGTALQMAARLGAAPLAQALLTARADPNAADARGRTALHEAATQGHVDIVKLLLQEGVSVNVADTSGITPLHGAASTADAECTHALLAANANARAADARGRTPLHEAARHGHADATRALLLAGAVPSAADARGRTPLHDAATPQVARLLRDAGADADARDALGAAPLHVAAADGRGDVVKVLLDTKVDGSAIWTLHCEMIDFSNRRGRAEVVWKALEDYCQNISLTQERDSVDVSQMEGPAEEIALTAIHVAAARGHADILRKLFRDEVSAPGVSEGEPPLSDVTPLHLAAAGGHEKAVRALLSSSGLEAAGVNVSAAARDGRTALHSAALRGDASVALVLLQAGADPSAADARGDTPGALAPPDSPLRATLGYTPPATWKPVSLPTSPPEAEPVQKETLGCSLTRWFCCCFF